MTYALYVDIDRCVGCEACTVACLDQNDLQIERKEQAWRRVFRVEAGAFPEAEVAYVSLACLHCEDAPCLLACPTGAIGRNPKSDAVEVDAARCIGCHSCSLACPFGIPRYGPDGTMQKCDLCSIRVEHGLEPACVRICPAKALRFGRLDEMLGANEAQAATRLARAVRAGRENR